MAILPPREALDRPVESKLNKLAQAGYNIPNFLKVERSPGGEMWSYHFGHDTPRKGIPYVEAIDANNKVKRITLAFLTPFSGEYKGIMGKMENFVVNYCRMADYFYTNCERCPYLKFDYYNTTSKGVWRLTETFLTTLGFQEFNAQWLAKVFATMLEYDEVYRMPIVDVMSEFTKEEILKSPRKFVLKFIRILNERSVDNKYLVRKFKGFAWVLSLLLLLPKFKKAFIKAFTEVDLQLLQYDKIDSYWALARGDYNYMGRTVEDRSDEHFEKVRQHWETLNGKKVVKKDLGNGVFSLEVVSE